MKILIIGYGSIGKRHESVLKEFSEISIIDIVTKQTLENKKTFYSLFDMDNLHEYDYFVIASETNKHYSQLQFLESNVSEKLIFCEKPLFEKSRILNITKNKIFVGYVLRFHPLLEKLKNELLNEKILCVNATCGQYLPSWRIDTDYRNSYSAKKSHGGGVLLDLSHEIDYVQWLFGKIESLMSFQLKISDLEIDSDDITTFIGKTQKGIIVNLSMDYISKITNRKMLVHTLDYSFELDFISNKLIKKDKKGIEEEFTHKDLERNYMFEKMHTEVLFNRKNICTFSEGLDVMNTIQMIQEQN